MADVPLLKGGTPVIRYLWHEDTPVVSRPPFGLRAFPGLHAPPFDAHYDGAMSGIATFAAGYPFAPRDLEWQGVNVRAGRPDVGDMLQMIAVPCNHYIQSVRLDVLEADPRMNGATVDIAGQWIREDPAEPARFIATDSLEIDDARTAQGITPVSLSAPSSTVVWLTRTGGAAAGTISGTADAGGTVTGSASVDTSSYAVPLYVPPVFIGGERHQGGALVLGLRIKSLPTLPDTGFDSLQGALYLTTRIDGYECPAFA
jgi:hypothetical protein